jgi:hypothetical protein
MPQFLISRGDDLLHLGLDWEGFLLQVGDASPDGRLRLSATNVARVILTFPPQIVAEAALTPFDDIPLPAHLSLSSTVVFSVPAGVTMELNARSVMAALSAPGASILSLGSLGEDLTNIEIPWGLLINVLAQSGGQEVVSDHAAEPLQSPDNVTGLFRARLRASDGDGLDARLLLKPISVLRGDDVRTPLTGRDRQMILHNSALALPRMRRLELGTLGGSLSASATWSNGEAWDHDIVMGRDQHVHVVMTGVLFPFGHRATITTLTERRFPDDPPPAHSVAALISSARLVIDAPIRATLAPHFPFDTVEIITTKFAINIATENVFIPTVPGSSVQLKIPVRCTGPRGEVRFDAQMVFVSSTFPDTSKAENLWRPNSRIDLPNGVSIDMVRGDPPREGDIHEVYAITISGEPDDGDSYLPVVSEFTATLPALRALMCKTASEPAAAPASLRYSSVPGLAFDLLNGTVPVNFTDRPERSGGLMAPRFDADGISRTLGLVARDALNPTASSVARIYKDATLLGVPLAKIIKSSSPTVRSAADARRFDRGDAHGREISGSLRGHVQR